MVTILNIIKQFTVTLHNYLTVRNSLVRKQEVGTRFRIANISRRGCLNIRQKTKLPIIRGNIWSSTWLLEIFQNMTHFCKISYIKKNSQRGIEQGSLHNPSLYKKMILFRLERTSKIHRIWWKKKLLKPPVP